MQTLKHALKVVGTFLFMAVWGSVFFLFLALGVVALMVGEFVRKQGRRTAFRLRGDRFSRSYAPPVQLPYMFMDADGFVEPPSERALTFGTASRLAYSTAPASSVVVAGRAQLKLLAAPTASVLAFPADPAVRASLAARRPVSRAVAGASEKVVSLTQYRPSRKH